MKLWMRSLTGNELEGGRNPVLFFFRNMIKRLTLKDKACILIQDENGIIYWSPFISLILNHEHNVDGLSVTHANGVTGIFKEMKETVPLNISEDEIRQIFTEI